MSVRCEIRDVGKLFGRRWALRRCAATFEPGSVTAIVGPNGAGKSTLLAAVAGLVAPTEGEIAVEGRPVAGRTDPAVGYLAQDKPLYRRWKVSELLAQTRDLNSRWDDGHARRLVDEARIPLDVRLGTLSGGQRTRLALVLVLGRRPDLVLLDEPLADLDPLARSQVQRTLMAEVAETGMTVLMSSHILGEVRDSCDALLLLQDGGIALHAGMDDLVERHRVLTGPATASVDWLPPIDVIEVRTDAHRTTVLVGTAPSGLPPGWVDEPAELEEIVVARMRSVPMMSSAESEPVR